MPDIYEAFNRITDFDELAQAVYLRVERQTLIAFPELNRYLFAIHTYMNPLAEVLITIERMQLMLDVLKSMSADLYSHRGYVKVMVGLLQQKLIAADV